MKKKLIFLGLDVHAQNITIGVAPGDSSAPYLHGTISHDLHALEKLLAQLKKAHDGAELRVC